MSSALVRAELGASTARLYERLIATAARARAKAARPALGRIVLELTCGTYHDFKSPAPMPKAELVEALRGVPVDGSAAAVRALIDDIIAGRFAEDAAESARWTAAACPRAPAEPAAPPAPAPPAALTPRQRAVLAWIIRHREVYQRSPQGKEIADGLGLGEMKVSNAIRQLEAKGALARLDEIIPTRAP